MLKRIRTWLRRQACGLMGHGYYCHRTPGGRFTCDDCGDYCLYSEGENRG